LEPQVLPEVGCETLNFGEILNAIYRFPDVVSGHVFHSYRPAVWSPAVGALGAPFLPGSIERARYSGECCACIVTGECVLSLE
jgi:hypothetical protein